MANYRLRDTNNITRSIRMFRERNGGQMQATLEMYYYEAGLDHDGVSFIFAH